MNALVVEYNTSLRELAAKYDVDCLALNARPRALLLTNLDLRRMQAR